MSEMSSEERAAEPGSAFPTSGDTHDVDDGRAALEQMPDGNATVADQVDDAGLDSEARDEVEESGQAE